MAPAPGNRRPVYHRETAQQTLSRGQRVVGTVVLVAYSVWLLADLMTALRALVVVLLFFSAAHLTLRFVLVFAGRKPTFPPRTPVATEDLPRYTTLHPMYDEAHMIEKVVAAMEALDYPKDRLQCLLVLEERDRATVEAARRYPLPDYFQIVETPAVKPYGKPKACNHALQYATGEYVVIFDAEDKPDPQQLRRAVETFRAADERGEQLGCVQARLSFDNRTPTKGPLGEVVRDPDGYDVRPTTWCTRFLGNEYVVHFELVLAGLARLGLPVPLGGTSNHFPIAVLHDVAFEPEVMPEMPRDDRTTGAWDPWNVTEDAELGGAIAANGYSTAIFDSWTDEEAVLTPLAALNQRSRWVKGYAQTSLVLLRRPIRNLRAMGALAFFVYLLQVGGTFVSLFIAPLTWMLTVAFIVTKSQFIIDMYPGPLLYLGLLLNIGGNLGILSISLVAALRDKQYGAVRFLMFVTPVWWTLLSAATWLATLELVFPNWRPAWNKTAHGIRYATRRRLWWLGVQARFRTWESRPTGQARPQPSRTRPALAPRPRTVVGELARREPLLVPAAYLPRTAPVQVGLGRRLSERSVARANASADRAAARAAARASRRPIPKPTPVRRPEAGSFGVGVRTGQRELVSSGSR